MINAYMIDLALAVSIGTLADARGYTNMCVGCHGGAIGYSLGYCFDCADDVVLPCGTVVDGRMVRDIQLSEVEAHAENEARDYARAMCGTAYAYEEMDGDEPSFTPRKPRQPRNAGRPGMIVTLIGAATSTPANVRAGTVALIPTRMGSTLIVL